MGNNILIGINESGTIHCDSDPLISLEEKFKRVAESGVFDYFDKTPPSEKVDEYKRLSEIYELPILAGGWFYVLGRDEDLLYQNLKLGAHLGSLVHNTQIMMDHANGELVTNEKVAEIYIRAYEYGEKLGCIPTFEIHVNMWSEDFKRVEEVENLVSSRGIPFCITLDHSHVIFKMNNIREQKVFNIQKEIDDGTLILDPSIEGNICEKWINSGLVRHCHARSSVPNNPKNIWQHHKDIEKLPSSQHPKDTVGRGIQYPFIRPKAGEWHSDWDGEKLTPWKQVVEMLMKYHASEPSSDLKTISTEFIPFPDYGGGSKYSIFENSVACAEWLKKTWKNIGN
jgi:hypothetical protein